METYTSLNSSSKMDMTDLSQECYSYMKIKQFLADRLSQQQEEIDTLRRQVKYYVARDVSNKDMISKLTTQLNYLKKKEGNVSFCSEEAFSHELDSDSKGNKKEQDSIEEQTEEEMRAEINRLTVDKFILVNELNELLMGLKRCKLEKLNELIMVKNKDFCQSEMPCVSGLQMNVLSADSQLSQIIRTDYRRSNLSGVNNAVTKESLEYYDTLVKECEKSFTNLLEKKLQIHKGL